MSAVEHPGHYGGEDNPFEVIKVAEAWHFDEDAYLFNVLKYIARPGKGNYLEDLKKARFYLERKISNMETALADEPEDEPEVREDDVPFTTWQTQPLPPNFAVPYTPWRL